MEGTACSQPVYIFYPHTVEIFRYALGPVTSVTAVTFLRFNTKRTQRCKLSQSTHCSLPQKAAITSAIRYMADAKGSITFLIKGVTTELAQTGFRLRRNLFVQLKQSHYRERTITAQADQRQSIYL